MDVADAGIYESLGVDGKAWSTLFAMIRDPAEYVIDTVESGDEKANSQSLNPKLWSHAFQTWPRRVF